jgi:hypothetical protein
MVLRRGRSFYRSSGTGSWPLHTDIIYYGADLAHYLVNEFIAPDRPVVTRTQMQAVQKIRIWSYLADDWDWQLDDR